MSMSPRLLRPRQSGFNPKSISGLLAWYDAADSSSYTTSTGVSEWRDKSGSGLAIRQPTANNQPATGTRSLNAKNVFDFDGTNDALPLGGSTSSYAIDLAASRAVTIIAVVASDVAVAGARFLSLQRVNKNANDSGIFIGRLGSGSGSIDIAAGAGASTSNDQIDKNNVVTFPDTSTAAAVYTVRISAADNLLAAYKNGTQQTLTSRYGTLPASGFLQEGTGLHTLDIGASRTSANALGAYWNGIVAEVMLWTRSLSDSERQRAERALGAKWGITVA